MAKGRLTTAEKYVIQGMLQNGKTIKEVQILLDRTNSKVIRNYVVNELDDILETITRIRLDKGLSGDKTAFDDMEVDSQNDSEVSENLETGNKEISSKEVIKRKLTQQEEPVLISNEIINKTEQMLRGTGLKKPEALDLLRRTHKRLNRPPVDAKEFFSLCIQSLNANDKMISEAEGGREGVKIMTAAASAALDEAGKKYRSKDTTSRSARGNMFNPKTEQTY